MEDNKLQKANENTTAIAASDFNFFDPVQFETMQRICTMFANSELVPDMYQITEKNPKEKAVANCMIAVEIAHRIGASPLMVMQNMVPIYGRPSWSSKFLIATVNTCGRFNPLQYRFTDKGMLGKVEYTTYTKTWIDGTNGRKGYYKNEAKKEVFDGSKIKNIECVAFTTAKGSKDLLESTPVDLKLAIEEGWYTKAGSKWPTMTRQMLTYRAASFWTNAYAPELSMGMKTVEEMEDIGHVIDVDYEDVTDRVSKEMAENANKTPLSMDDAPEETDNKPENAPEETDGQAQESSDAPTEDNKPGSTPEGGLFPEGDQQNNGPKY